MDLFEKLFLTIYFVKLLFALRDSSYMDWNWMDDSNQDSMDAARWIPAEVEMPSGSNNSILLRQVI
jgi:hypothetical protein